MGRGRKIAIAAVLATALAVLPAGAAEATFPGENGKIAFSGRMATDTSNEIYTINPDGTDLTRPHRLSGTRTRSRRGARTARSSRSPPSGTHTECGLLCTEIYSMNADGSIADPPDPTTPDVQRHGTGLVAGRRRDRVCKSHVGFRRRSCRLMNADGTNQHTIPSERSSSRDPTWSPQGDRIAFEQRRTNPSWSTRTGQESVLSGTV